MTQDTIPPPLFKPKAVRQSVLMDRAPFGSSEAFDGVCSMNEVDLIKGPNTMFIGLDQIRRGWWFRLNSDRTLIYWAMMDPVMDEKLIPWLIVRDYTVIGESARTIRPARG